MSEPEVRRAAVEDAPLLARHRRLMFDAMGQLGPGEAVALEQAAERYLRDALPTQRYAGWIAEIDGVLAASGGVLIRELVPRPGFVGGEREGLILSMWTEPAYRRRGLARKILEVMLAWCTQQDARRIVLHASSEGRPLYELLGFRPTNEMRLDRPRASQSP